MASEFEEFLLEDQHQSKKYLFKQHILSVAVAGAFCFFIGHYYFGVEAGVPCEYTDSEGDSSDIASWFRLTLLLLFIFHLVDGIRSLIIIFYIALQKRKGEKQRTLYLDLIY